MLIIEDSDFDAKIFMDMLSRAPKQQFETVHVTSLEDGLKKLAEDHFHVLLLDLILPDSQGMDTFLKVCKASLNVPIVVLTVLDDENLALRAVQQGAQDYLVKGSFDSELLLRSIRYAVERNRMQEVLRSLSFLDELTGLYNRRGFMSLAEQQLKIAVRVKRELVLLYADLDNLKAINDTHGHAQGDMALVKTAEILKETFRTSDVIARLGGDEFAVLAIDVPNSNVEIISKRLHENFAQHNRKHKLPYTLSLSIGMTTFNPRDPVPVEKLLSRADRSLYEKKRDKGTTK